MPSRASFFNGAVYRKNLTRFAPLWLAYLAFWMIVMPFSVLSHRGQNWYNVWALRETALGSVQISAIVCLAYAILVAMALHGWYYRSAGVNAFGALPIRRETWFFTNLLTALTMGLGPHLIVALSTWAAAASIGLAGGTAALSWLAINSMVYLFFYAVAALCAAVAGQILALPALYILVNFAAAVVSYVTVTILSTFVYGMNAHARVLLAPFSPAYYLLTRDSLSYDYTDEGVGEIIGVAFRHWGYLLGLTVAAVILLTIAFLLFRRRRMEAAGDMIAVRPLRPVFKYCFATGCALVAGTLSTFVFLTGRSGPTLGVMLIWLLAGGFIGYFTAEILLKKTFRVFGREWIGFGAFSLCLIAAVLMMEFDVTGFERRVPDLEDVESVSVQAFSKGGGSFEVDDPALIADFMALHRSIIQDKSNQEVLFRNRGDFGDVDFARLYLDYHLRDGSVMERLYDVYCSREQWRSGTNGPASVMSELFSDPAILQLIYLPEFPVQGPENILSVRLDNYAVDTILSDGGEVGEYEGRAVARSDRTVTLLQEEAWELFNACFLPDLRDGKLGKADLFYFRDETEYCASISFRFMSSDAMHRQSSRELTLLPDSRTAQYFLDRGDVLLTNEEANDLMNEIK